MMDQMIWDGQLGPSVAIIYGNLTFQLIYLRDLLLDPLYLLEIGITTLIVQTVAFHSIVLIRLV